MGYTEAQLRSYLLGQGWPAGDVYESINLAKNPQQESSAISSHKTKSIFIAVIVLIVITGTVFVAAHLFGGPNCGNSSCEEGESADNCCADCGCRGEQTCEENICVEPVCGECEYVYSHECVAYECCSDSECNLNEECKANKCSPILCDECELAVDHTCTAITECSSGDDCCPRTCDHSSDTDCEEADYGPIDADYNDTDETDDHECIDEIDCDDLDDCTIDQCNEDGICSYTKVTECISDDLCCPEGCDDTSDNDCEYLY